MKLTKLKLTKEWRKVAVAGIVCAKLSTVALAGRKATTITIKRDHIVYDHHHSLGPKRVGHVGEKSRRCGANQFIHVEALVCLCTCLKI